MALYTTAILGEDTANLQQSAESNDLRISAPPSRVVQEPMLRNSLAAGVLGLIGMMPAVCSAQAPQGIGPATVLDVGLKAGGTHTYTLRLTLGESATVVVRQQGIDVVVDVTAPDGKLLDSIDGPTGRNGDEVVEIIAKQTGDYSLRVRPLGPDEPTGKYRLEVKDLRGTEVTNRLLNERRQARQAATEWLRPRSARIPISGVIPQGVDLPPLRVLAERVRVLGIGEATHGSREFGDLRLSLTKRLIEQHGYRVVALEASATRMRKLLPYVNGEAVVNATVARLLDSGWIGRRSRRELVEWVRGWNLQHSHDRVRLIGVDAQDNADSRTILGSFLERAYGPEVLAHWKTAEAELQAADEQTAVFGDSSVNPATRQFVLEALAMLDSDTRVLNARFGRGALHEAQEAARDLAQFVDFNGDGGAISHSRDWYMAVNVLRALQDEGPSARAVYWAHNAHVAITQASSRTTGSLLRSTLGCDYGALAADFGEGAFVAQIPNDPEDRLAISTVPAGSDESIEAALASLAFDASLVGWSCNTDQNSLPAWLSQPHPMHWVGGLYAPDSLPSSASRPFVLTAAFDGIVYLPRVTAEEIPRDRPIIPARKH